MTIAETTAKTKWIEFAPTTPEVPRARWEDFFKSAPKGTLIALVTEHLTEHYLKTSGSYWVDLQDIEQADEEWSRAGFSEVPPMTLHDWARGRGRNSIHVAVRVLQLGEES